MTALRIADRIGSGFRLCGTFFAWWIGELAAMVPRRLVHWSKRRRRRLLLLPDAGQNGCRACRERDGRRQEVMFIGIDADERVQSRLHDEVAEADEIVLLLPASAALCRIVNLPRLDDATLAQLIPNELDRFTPFSAEEAWFDWRPLPSASDAERRKIELVVMPADRTAAALALAQRLRISPHRVGLDGDSGEPPFDLLRWRSKPRATSLLPRLAYIAAAALLVALIVAIVSAWDAREEDTLVSLRQAVTAIRRDAEVGDRQRRELVILRERAIFLDTLQKRRLLAADIAALTLALPDDAWLHALQFNGGRLQIGGQARDAAELIQRIETQDGLRNAQFRQPVTKAGNSVLDRFEISLDRVSGATR